MEHEWVEWAKRLGFETEREMWERLYITNCLSIAKLAKLFKRGNATVERRLKLHHINVRDRGGPNNSLGYFRKLHMIDPRVLFLAPPRTVAQIVDVHITTVEKFKRRLLRKEVG